jgi:hypothetical protein
MNDPIRRLVVCTCGGKVSALAIIDDQRPTGGGLTVTEAEAGGKHIVAATGYRPGVKNWRAPDSFVTSKWAENTVTETMWSDERLGWTIRCPGCRKQAELNSKTLQVITDEMAQGEAHASVKLVDGDAWLLPLGVLCRRLSRPM